ncbi:MAG: oxygen-dependent coproporphyrinogen oxidase [Cyclobacteriaceae bacterium]
MSNRINIQTWFEGLQDSICHGLETLDGKGRFKEDKWTRNEGGGGRSRVIEHGSLIEKGGVNFSAVEGPLPKKIQDSLKLSDSDFYATGVSIVLHPINPWVPIIHMNVRYFETKSKTDPADTTYWFGGGIDLTPHYVDSESGKHIHQVLKNACDEHHPEYYTRFKKWADDYFYIKHREETRGVGGIFYDRLNDMNEHLDFNQLWAFQQSIGESFLPIYQRYAEDNRDKPYTDDHKSWQSIRRGRYVEFNLVWDKGTKFGLDTGGRTESILMSMPPLANWRYDHQPTTGSPEAETLKWLKKDIEWV